MDHDPAELYARAPVGLLVLDQGERVVAANDTACQWLGYPQHELVGQRQLADLFTMGARLFHQTHLAPLLQMQGSVAEVQLQLRCRDGALLPCLVAVRRVATAAGFQDELALMVASDRRKYEQELLQARHRAEVALEERRAALDALEQSQARLQAVNTCLRAADRRKDEFLAVLAHELRNPLAPLRSGIDLLRRRPDSDPLVARTLAVFDRQVTAMQRLVDDLMDASRVSQGKIVLARAPLRLADVLHRAAEIAGPLFTRAAQHFAVEVQADPWVDGDVLRLTQAVTNLLNNASKYTPRGGTIRAVLLADAGGAELAVHDTGEGIPPEQLDAIFHMFSQLDAGAARTQGGIGIGLALVRGLVDLHGGSITATSAGPGLGSSFRLRLPVIVAPAPSPSRAVAPAALPLRTGGALSGA